MYMRTYSDAFEYVLCTIVDLASQRPACSAQSFVLWMYGQIFLSHMQLLWHAGHAHKLAAALHRSHHHHLCMYVCMFVCMYVCM